jgi:hypothetical protein
MIILRLINLNNYFRRTVKQKSNKLLTYWMFQKESTFAQKLRQQQKSLTLYMRIWEEHAVKDFFQRFRKQVI